MRNFNEKKSLSNFVQRLRACKCDSVVIIVAALVIVGLATFGLVSAQKGYPNRNGGLDRARRFGDTERTCSPRPCAGQSNCSSDGSPKRR